MELIQVEFDRIRDDALVPQSPGSEAELEHDRQDVEHEYVSGSGPDDDRRRDEHRHPGVDADLEHPDEAGRSRNHDRAAEETEQAARLREREQRAVGMP